jgi:hypothetical protein
MKLPIISPGFIFFPLFSMTEYLAEVISSTGLVIRHRRLATEQEARLFVKAYLTWHYQDDDIMLTRFKIWLIRDGEYVLIDQIKSG